jgi:radical SAM protein with 4Fe4S-binding SPASM domain
MASQNLIYIANLLLTRKCNLKCSYCGIVRNYKNKPQEYPDLKHYYKNEMSTEYVLETLRYLKIHNPDIFVILYGGEPLLRKDLPQIVNFCNINSINYTIITNNTDEVQGYLETLLLEVETIHGLTSSVDPLGSNPHDDSSKKTMAALKKLVYYKQFIKDIVAEITVTNENVHNLYETVYSLTEQGINSDITFVDIAKTPFYDFSNIKNENLLVKNTRLIEQQILKIIDDKLNVHMAKDILPLLLDSLPSNYYCNIHQNVHNITLDADGTFRLCLRIKGIKTPQFKVQNVFDKNQISPLFKSALKEDKLNLCRSCNWPCVCMSDIISNKPTKLDDLIHSNIRD